MLSIQDQIWATAREACLVKAGVADDSPLWVENDLPSTQAHPSKDSVAHPKDDLEMQVENYANADGTHTDTSLESSPVELGA